jgi:hypothetical protein
MAKPNEKKVALINDYSYGTDYRFTHMSQTEDNEYKYPVIYGMPNKGIKYMYSNTKDNGHFGQQKIIIAKASSTIILDLKGKYGMTQFASAIVDTPENLIKIQKVFEKSIFSEFKSKFCGIGESSNKTALIDNKGTMFKFIKEFRKDFWKDFYTDDMEKELIQEGLLDGNGKYTGK